MKVFSKDTTYIIWSDKALKQDSIKSWKISALTTNQEDQIEFRQERGNIFICISELNYEWICDFTMF
jgi:hypothetical protein